MWKQLLYFPVGHQFHCSAIIENLVWMRILKFKLGLWHHRDKMCINKLLSWFHTRKESQSSKKNHYEYGSIPFSFELGLISNIFPKIMKKIIFKKLCVCAHACLCTCFYKTFHISSLTNQMNYVTWFESLEMNMDRAIIATIRYDIFRLCSLKGCFWKSFRTWVVFKWTF